MHKKTIQSLVLIAFVAILIFVVSVRTQDLWQRFARHTVRESLDHKLLVLTHLVLQRAQALEEAFLATLNKKNAGNLKVIYFRFLQKNSSGQWVLVDAPEVPGTGAYFVKQLPGNEHLAAKQWLSLRHSSGEVFAGLVLPVTTDQSGLLQPAPLAQAKYLAFGVFKNHFGEIFEIFKGAGARFALADERNYILAHSSSDYQGAALPADFQKIIASPQQNIFTEKKVGQKSEFIVVAKIPEIRLVVGAMAVNAMIPLTYYRWLFELIAGGFILLILGLFYIHRKSDDLSQPLSTQPSKMASVVAPLMASPALPKKDFVSSAKENPASRPTTQIIGFEEVPVAQALAAPPSHSARADIKQIVIASLAEVESDIRLFGVQLDDKLSDVPDVWGDKESLKKAIEGLLKLTFFSVRQKMAKKVKINLQRFGKNVELVLSDNGLPRKTTEDALLNDLITQAGLSHSVQEAFHTIRRLKGNVALKYDFFNGNQIIVRLPLAEESTAKESESLTPPGPRPAEAIKKQFYQYQLKNLSVNVRKPRIREIEND